MGDKNKADGVPKLSDGEWEIVKPLWEHGPMAARDVFQHVSKHQDWAYKTVKTMLARLVKKGAIEYDQIGNSYLYRAAFTREEITNEATGSFIQRVFDGALTPFLARFAEQADESELKVLRSELRRIEKKKAARDKKEG